MKDSPLVAILMGSDSDRKVMRGAESVLESLGIPYQTKIRSAHRTPEETASFIAEAVEKGVKVFIAGAGMAAHLAGAVAAQTVLPVIGVPIASGPLAGQDALLATVQMPSGIPVATVAIDGAKNAGFLAAQILGISDADRQKKLWQQRDAKKNEILALD
jgi:phosphoribosylaminoimidazole carboxylase PurE protein